MALRRWKPFLASFEHIDAAIESATGGSGPEAIISREEFKQARTRIVEALCGAADDAAAEGICRLLDDAMAESLVTLRTAAAHAGTQMELLASGEVVAAVGELASGHGSVRVRGLARDVALVWRAAVEAELGTAMAAMHALDAASGVVFDGHGDGRDAEGRKKQSTIPERPTPCQRKTLPPVVGGGGRVNAEPKKMPLVVRGGCSAKTVASKTALAPQPKRTSPPAARGLPLSSCCADDKKMMEATKRKLHERYQEAEDAKPRRKIRMVVAPELLRQQGPPTAHPAVKAPACSAAEGRRFKVSSSLRRV